MSSTLWGVLAGGAVALGAWSARRALVAGFVADVRLRLGHPITAAPTRWVWRPVRTGAERRRLVADLPGALEDVARSLRSGTSLRVALAEASSAAAGPARSDLGVVVERIDRGVPVGAALDAWVVRRPAAEVRLAVAALGLGLDAGYTSARTVDGVAATLRERAAVAGEVAAQAAQARLSALVIALLPVAFTSWACLTDGRIAGFLLASPAGWACLLGGVTLNVVGAAWMARIMRSVQ